MPTKRARFHTVKAIGVSQTRTQASATHTTPSCMLVIASSLPSSPAPSPASFSFQCFSKRLWGGGDPDQLRVVTQGDEQGRKDERFLLWEEQMRIPRGFLPSSSLVFCSSNLCVPSVVAFLCSLWCVSMLTCSSSSLCSFSTSSTSLSFSPSLSAETAYQAQAGDRGFAHNEWSRDKCSASLSTRVRRVSVTITSPGSNQNKMLPLHLATRTHRAMCA